MLSWAKYIGTCIYKRIHYSLNRPVVILPGGVTPNASFQVGHANFEGTEFKVEPDGSIAGRQMIPHYLVTMRGNLIALKRWVQGDGEQQEHLCRLRNYRITTSFPQDSMTIIMKLGENILVSAQH